MDGFAHFYINAAFAQLFLDACEDDFEGILKVRPGTNVLVPLDGGAPEEVVYAPDAGGNAAEPDGGR
jgi:hypothetical protein